MSEGIMETVTQQPNIAEEFDHYRRRYNDAATWFAEILDGSMRTPFEFTHANGEIYAEDGGALSTVFKNALLEAEHLAANNPELAFELPRRQAEAAEFDAMVAMAQGRLPNTMVVISDFPHALMNASKDVGGYNVSRKQAMLRVITYRDNRLQMFTQSLDGSDRQALESIYYALGETPMPGELVGQRIHLDLDSDQQMMATDQAMNIYDTHLAQTHGGSWHAGRQELAHDTYNFVLSQHELIHWAVENHFFEPAKRNALYDLAALMTKRFEAAKNVSISYDIEPEYIVEGYFAHHLEHQMRMAGREARATGKTFSGCGASAGGSSESDFMKEAGYGNQSQDDADEDQFGPLTFTCKFGHTNRRPRGKLISSCRIKSCKNSVAC
jgi:hypothetical protein